MHTFEKRELLISLLCGKADAFALALKQVEWSFALLSRAWLELDLRLRGLPLIPDDIQ